jgi:hypothetical protein
MCAAAKRKKAVPVNEKEAYKLAVRLTTIPDCPRVDQAIEALAEDIEKLCTDDDEARWLVDRAREWPKWMGKAGLIELMKEKRPALAPERRIIDLGPKPPVNCAACQDWGHLFRNGQRAYCSCAAGVQLQADQPDFLEKMRLSKLTDMRALQTSAPRRPITEGDLQKAFAERQNRTDEMIDRAEKALAAEESTADQKEMAREILRGASAKPN